MQRLFPALTAALIGQSGAMPQMKKLGFQLQVGLSLDLPVELMAIIVATSHPKRLQALYRGAAERLLRAHREVLRRPISQAAGRERLRSKALLDLVRARSAALGSRKPSVEMLLALMDGVPPKNVIEIRKVA